MRYELNQRLNLIYWVFEKKKSTRDPEIIIVGIGENQIVFKKACPLNFTKISHILTIVNVITFITYNTYNTDITYITLKTL